MINYNEILKLAKENGKSVSELIALAQQNDPFYADCAGRRASAEWFAEQYAREGFASGTHIRRIHYRLISREGQTDWRGNPYLNTSACWQALLCASRDARYLGTVPLEDFDDRRNPTATAAGIALPEDPSLEPMGAEAAGLCIDRVLSIPRLTLNAAENPAQPYHLEVWSEKSTMRDITEDISDRYGITCVYSLGEISLTACVKLILDRVTHNGDRPIRILYLSDFDPAGQSIPVAAARKVEWLIRQHDLDVDLQLIPILLNHDQCVQYRLPRTPIKEGEGRSDDWQHRFGEGGTELDALEALHPGELERIIREALDRYHDHDLQDRWDQLISERRDALSEIATEVQAEYAAALRPYQQECARLAWEANDLRERAQMIFGKIIADIEARAENVLDPLSEFKSEREADEHPDPLYDSKRPYMDQLARYKLFQGRNEEWGKRRRAKRARWEREARAKKKRDIGIPESRVAATAKDTLGRDIGIPESRPNGGDAP